VLYDNLYRDRQHTHDVSVFSSDEELFDGAAGGIDGELARGNQGERGLVNGNAVDVCEHKWSYTARP
jgi:hypothetical protein